MTTSEEALARDKRLLEEALELRLGELAEKIEALERTEAELRESLARYDALTANIPFGVFRFRQEPGGAVAVEYLSSRIAELTGISKENGLEEPMAFVDKALAVGRAEYLEAVDKAFREKRSFSWEGEAVVRGRVRVLRIEMNPQKGTGESLVYNGTVEDVTDEREERRRRARLLGAVDGMAIALAAFRSAVGEAAQTDKVADWASLSEREAQVAELLLLGLSNKELAGRLFISESTIKKHIAAVFGKLGVSSRAELFRLSRSQGASS